MFLQVSVILLTGGVSASVHAGIPPGADTTWGRQPPWEQTPPEQTPRADTPKEQTPPQEQTPP